MSLRFHEIAETNHRILNPFTEQQLTLLGELCRIKPEHRQLDLCSGKGEMLARWSEAYGHSGIGVDISKVFLAAAEARAIELGVNERISYVRANAATYDIERNGFDIASCIGATWIGNGLVGTLKMMRPGLRNENSLLLVGEPFWRDDPPDAAYQAIASGDRSLFVSLPETLARFDDAELELIEMVLANEDSWDRYVAPQWAALSDWLRANADDPDWASIRDMHEASRREYFEFTRRFLGWGVFVLRQR